MILLYLKEDIKEKNVSLHLPDIVYIDKIIPHTLAYLMLRTGFWSSLTNHYSHDTNEKHAVYGGCDLPKVTQAVAIWRFEFRFSDPCPMYF